MRIDKSFKLLTLIIFQSIFPLIIFASEKPAPPNFVFILADDLGYSQLGCYGSNYYVSPHIDQLATDGLRFVNAYSASPVCSPTRASIVTGKHPARLNVTDFIAGNKRNDYPLTQPDWQKYLPLSETTFAEILKENGYKTAIFGKWHLSKEKTPPGSLPFNPDKQGFDETFVTFKPSGGMMQSWQDAENDAHNVDTITNLALNFLERNHAGPFFLFVSHNTIHDPLKEKRASIEKFKKQAKAQQPENHPLIAAMIARLDESCGKIFRKIEELGISENTVVIFYSDNGGKHSYAKQTPLRAGKGWLYEGGIRVPLIVKWEGKVKPKSVSEALVSSIDFFPTFIELSGSEKDLNNIDGKSLASIMSSPSKNIHDNLFWHYPHYHAGSGMQPAGAVRSGNFKLIEWFEKSLTGAKNAYELYNLQTDIGETNNIFDENPEIAEELILLMKNWRKNVNAQMPTINNGK